MSLCESLDSILIEVDVIGRRLPLVPAIGQSSSFRSTFSCRNLPSTVSRLGRKRLPPILEEESWAVHELVEHPGGQIVGRLVGVGHWAAPRLS